MENKESFFERYCARIYFIFLQLIAIFLIYLDLTTSSLALVPSFTHGLFFYFILYHARILWGIYAVIFSFCLDLISNLPIGNYMLSMFLLIMLYSHARTELKQGDFGLIWYYFAVAECIWAVYQTLFIMMVFNQEFEYIYLVKSLLTITSFPLVFWVLLRGSSK